MSHAQAAIDLLARVDEARRQSIFVHVDPPYLTRSSGLYLDEMSFDGHKQIAFSDACVLDNNIRYPKAANWV